MRLAGVRPGVILRAVAVPLSAAGLAYAGYWWGSGGGGPEPPPPPPRPAAVRPDLRVSGAILRELIAREMSLDSPDRTAWETVNRIRDWAAGSIDFATESYLLDRDTSFRFQGRSAPEIFEAFFQDRGGVLCDGAAFALMELYTLFGFQASTLDHGQREVMTHVVTLVTISVLGKSMTVVQDPTFNLSYATRSGAPVDYFEMLTALGRHEHRQIRFHYGSRRTRDVLVHPKDEGSASAFRLDRGQRPVRLLENGVKKYALRFTSEAFDRAYGAKIRAFLRGKGYPGHLLYLHRFPVGGSDQGILERARRLTQGTLRP